MFLTILDGKLYLAPIRKDPHVSSSETLNVIEVTDSARQLVLDVGAGTGIWTM